MPRAGNIDTLREGEARSEPPVAIGLARRLALRA